MIWIFGLVTGLVFDMPGWWWVMGFIMGLFNFRVYIMVKQ